MKDELVFFKTALRNLDYKHVSSEIKDNIEMRATYKNRNYIFHFNSKYKIIVVEQIESLHEHEFDDRLFENNWYEDFTNKLDTYTEEELFLMIETFSSYFYKIYANKWNGEKIDLFVIEYFNEKAIEYTKRYESDFEKWYAFWDEYFTDDVREKYLKSKKKLKS